MVHEIAVSCGNGTESVGLGLPKIDHGKNHCLWFREACMCMKIGANRIVGSRQGAGTPFGAGSYVHRVCSHMSGTDRRLLGMTGKNVCRRTMCSKQVRVSRKLGRRGWQFKSWRRLQQCM